MIKLWVLGLYLLADWLHLVVLALQSRRCARGRESILTQATRVLSGARNQTPPDFEVNALIPFAAQSLVRLARRSDRCDAGNFHRLASPRPPVLLAQEVP